MLNPDIDAQELVYQYAGTTGATTGGGLLGKPGSREIIKTDKVIGKYYDNDSLKFVDTKNFTIHYAKDGVHIMPARP